MTTPRKTKAKKKTPPVARKTKAAAPKRPPPKPKVAAKKKADAKVRTPKRAEPKPKAEAKKQVLETPARKKAVPAKPRLPAKAPKPRPLAKAVKPRPPAKPKPPKPKPAKVKPAKVEPKPPKPKPVKPSIDRALRNKLREALVSQRERLLAVVQSAKAQMAAKQTDLADVSDRASEGYGDELAVGLMAIEAAQLEDIETAIRRIDDRSYGLCSACGNAIPRPRLEVLPFVRRCLACEGLRERGSPPIGTYADTDD